MRNSRGKPDWMHSSLNHNAFKIVPNKCSTNWDDYEKHLLPPDWIDKLAAIFAKHIESVSFERKKLTKEDITEYLRIHTNLGTQKADSIKKFYIKFYAIFSRSVTPEKAGFNFNIQDPSAVQEAISTLTEGLINCTDGVFERANLILQKWIMPATIAGVLSILRQKEISNYIATHMQEHKIGEAYEPHYDSFCRWIAGELGFVPKIAKPSYTTEWEREGDDGLRLQDKIKTDLLKMCQEYTPIYLIQHLENNFKFFAEKPPTFEVYKKELNSNPSDENIRKKWIETLNDHHRMILDSAAEILNRFGIKAATDNFIIFEKFDNYEFPVAIDINYDKIRPHIKAILIKEKIVLASPEAFFPLFTNRNHLETFLNLQNKEDIQNYFNLYQNNINFYIAIYCLKDGIKKLKESIGESKFSEYEKKLFNKFNSPVIDRSYILFLLCRLGLESGESNHEKIIEVLNSYFQNNLININDIKNTLLEHLKKIEDENTRSIVILKGIELCLFNVFMDNQEAENNFQFQSSLLKLLPAEKWKVAISYLIKKKSIATVNDLKNIIRHFDLSEGKRFFELYLAYSNQSPLDFLGFSPDKKFTKNDLKISFSILHYLSQENKKSLLNIIFKNSISLHDLTINESFSFNLYYINHVEDRWLALEISKNYDFFTQIKYVRHFDILLSFLFPDVSNLAETDKKRLYDLMGDFLKNFIVNNKDIDTVLYISEMFFNYNLPFDYINFTYVERNGKTIIQNYFINLIENFNIDVLNRLLKVSTASTINHLFDSIKDNESILNNLLNMFPDKHSLPLFLPLTEENKIIFAENLVQKIKKSAGIDLITPMTFLKFCENMENTTLNIFIETAAVYISTLFPYKSFFLKLLNICYEKNIDLFKIDFLNKLIITINITNYEMNDIIQLIKFSSLEFIRSKRDDLLSKFITTKIPLLEIISILKQKLPLANPVEIFSIFYSKYESVKNDESLFINLINDTNLKDIHEFMEILITLYSPENITQVLNNLLSSDSSFVNSIKRILAKSPRENVYGFFLNYIETPHLKKIIDIDSISKFDQLFQILISLDIEKRNAFFKVFLNKNISSYFTDINQIFEILDIISDENKILFVNLKGGLPTFLNSVNHKQLVSVLNQFRFVDMSKVQPASSPLKIIPILRQTLNSPEKIFDAFQEIYPEHYELLVNALSDIFSLDKILFAPPFEKRLKLVEILISKGLITSSIKTEILEKIMLSLGKNVIQTHDPISRKFITIDPQRKFVDLLGGPLVVFKNEMRLATTANISEGNYVEWMTQLATNSNIFDRALYLDDATIAAKIEILNGINSTDIKSADQFFEILSRLPGYQHYPIIISETRPTSLQSGHIYLYPMSEGVNYSLLASNGKDEIDEPLWDLEQLPKTYEEMPAHEIDIVFNTLTNNHHIIPDLKSEFVDKVSLSSIVNFIKINPECFSKIYLHFPEQKKEALIAEIQKLNLGSESAVFYNILFKNPEYISVLNNVDHKTLSREFKTLLTCGEELSLQNIETIIKNIPSHFYTMLAKISEKEEYATFAVEFVYELLQSINEVFKSRRSSELKNSLILRLLQNIALSFPYLINALSLKVSFLENESLIFNISALSNGRTIEAAEYSIVSYLTCITKESDHKRNFEMKLKTNDTAAHFLYDACRKTTDDKTTNISGLPKSQANILKYIANILRNPDNYISRKSLIPAIQGTIAEIAKFNSGRVVSNSTARSSNSTSVPSVTNTKPKSLKSRVVGFFDRRQNKPAATPQNDVNSGVQDNGQVRFTLEDE